MKDEYKTSLALVVLVLLFIGLIYYIFHIGPDSFAQLRIGESARDFCVDKCLTKDVYGSNRNVEYGFVRCECVEEIVNPESKINAARVYPRISVLYFDLDGEVELSEGQVLKMIESLDKNS